MYSDKVKKRTLLIVLLLVACMAVPTAVAETAVAAPKPTSVTLDQTGTIKLAWDGQFTRFTTLEHADAPA